jgi:tetratricopeptide (TPR) repeat protein
LPRRPRFTIAILVILLIVGFTATGFVVRGFNVRREQLAERWYNRGNQDLQRGAALQGIDEFQTALAYSGDNPSYRLKLALALMQAGKWEEARAHLLNLWEERPGDGEINLLLARVFAHRNLVPNAIRYYQGAIYGVWKSDPIASREDARFELAEYLLSHGRTDAAQAELIALAAEAPAVAAQQLRIANLMLQAGQPERALAIYREVRRKERRNFDAALGEAEAEFTLMRFAEAAAIAREAVGLRPNSNQATEILKDAEALVAADPKARGIGAAERARRALLAFRVAQRRLSSCAVTNPNDTALQQLSAQQQDSFPKLRLGALRDQDTREEAMNWVFQVERASANSCGAPVGADAALLKLAQAEETH